MNLLAAVGIGFLGSLHCIGMCGPLVMAIQAKSGSGILTQIIHNSGRVFTYMILGLFVGLIGEVIHLGGYQQYLSIILGAFIFLMAVSYSLSGTVKSFLGDKLIIPVKSIFGRFLGNKSIWSKFILGMVNGILPCGMVYFALGMGLYSENPVDGMLFMLLFGLGTWPAMLLTPSIMLLLTRFGVNFTRVITYFYALVGLLLLLRGLGLGIPLISPDFNHGNHGGH